MPRGNAACDADYIASIANKNTNKYPYSQMKNRLKLGEFERMERWRIQILNESVYSDGLKRGELPAKKYQKSAFKIGQEQTALADYQMGEMLNHFW